MGGTSFDPVRPSAGAAAAVAASGAASGAVPGVGTGATVVGGSQMPGVTVHGVELSREWSNCFPGSPNPQRSGPHRG